MARNKIAFGIGAGFVSLGIDGLAGLLILRLLTHYLPPAKAGFWVLVTSAGSFLLLLQCGMGPTIARAVAQSRAAGDDSAVGSVLGTVRIAFRFISLGVCIAAVVVFAAYLWPAAKRGHIQFGTALSWFPYAFGMAANLQGLSHLFVLDGYGEVGWDRVFRSFYSTIAITCAWLALYLGLNLTWIGAIYLVLNLLYWSAADWKLRGFLGNSVEAAPPKKGQVIQFFRDGSKLLLLNLAAYVVTQFTTFVVERQFGLKEVTPYTAMLRMGTLIASISGLVPLMLYPYTSGSWAAQDYRRCRRYYVFGLAASAGISLALSLLVFLLARPIFDLWLGKGQYLGSAIFGAILLFYVVYVHNAAHATPALAVVGNAFAVPAVVNMALVLLLIFFLPRRLGLIGIPLGMISGTVVPSAYVVWRSWSIVMRGPLGGSGDQIVAARAMSGI